MSPRARVIVTTYERLPHLRLALRAWERQSTKDFALTVADDGSGPETTAFVREFAAGAPFPVDHVWQEHQGFRRASVLNEAVRRSGTEPLILFTDGDCVPPARFLERHLAVHGPRTFAVGGARWIEEEPTRALDEATVARGGHERLGTWTDQFDLIHRAWKSRIGLWVRRRGRPKVVGLNLGIDRALFEEVNGYDESFVGYGLEDTDLRDRVMATRPRPRVRILYGRNDTIHLWHPPTESAGQRMNLPYYESERPQRCVRGLETLAGEH